MAMDFDEYAPFGRRPFQLEWYNWRSRRYSKKWIDNKKSQELGFMMTVEGMIKGLSQNL
jgi:hypothetical protein